VIQTQFGHDRGSCKFPNQRRTRRQRYAIDDPEITFLQELTLGPRRV
jgi:hypothetical protein